MRIIKLQKYIVLLFLALTGNVYYLLSQTPVIETPKPYIFPTYGGRLSPAPSIPNPAYPFYISPSQQRQNQQIMEEVENYQKQQNLRDQYLQEALRELEGNSHPVISYQLQGKEIPGRELFHQAFGEFQAMFDGQQPLSIKKAVFLYENAFDPSITWEGFNERIDNMVAHLGAVMQREKISPDDNLAKNMMLFRFFTDTLSVQHSPLERPATSYPMFYDFEDYRGHEDPHNLFVSKLMLTGTGQCHSLPLLYLILAEAIGAEAHLAFGPSHSYIKVQDHLNNWFNIELTTRSLTSDHFMMYSGFVKAEAIANQVYMHPLTTKDVVAQCLVDLGNTYVKKFGYEDFVLQCMFTAHEQGLKSMSLQQTIFNYYLTLHNHVLGQYEQYRLTRQDFEADEKAMFIYHQTAGAHEHIEKMGYAEMPAAQYERWLNSVKEEAQKQEHRNKMRALMSQLE